MEDEDEVPALDGETLPITRAETLKWWLALLALVAASVATYELGL